MPLRTKQGVVGAMQFVGAESGRRYDDADVALAEAAAGRIAEALDNAWLTEQHRAIAATLQQALLPPRLPRDRRPQRGRPLLGRRRRQPGGRRLLRHLPGRRRRWAVVIGDVCGTGPDAAAVTAIARHTIRAAATHGVAPSEVLEWLNDALYAGNRDLFCTTLYATVEPATPTAPGGTARSPAAIRSRSWCGPTARPSPSAARAAWSAPSRPSAPRRSRPRSQPGDTLVLYTDGVTDLHPPHHLDDAAFRAMVGETVTAPTAEAMIEQLRAAIDRWLPLADRHDDMALVVLHVNEPDGELTRSRALYDADRTWR